MKRKKSVWETITVNICPRYHSGYKCDYFLGNITRAILFVCLLPWKWYLNLFIKGSIKSSKLQSLFKFFFTIYNKWELFSIISHILFLDLTIWKKLPYFLWKRLSLLSSTDLTLILWEKNLFCRNSIIILKIVYLLQCPFEC